MPNVNFLSPRARFLDENGNPLSGGRIHFFEAGTDTLKNVYTTRDGVVLATNPNILDAEGFVTPSTGIHLGEGLYDIQVEKLIGVNQWRPYWTYPDIEGRNISNAGALLSIGYVNTIEELRLLAAGSYTMVYVAGYYTNGDGGARWVKWDASGTETDNGGTVIAPDGNPAIGRWDWLPQADEVVTPLLFGGFPSDGSLNIASQIDSMINWCLADDNHKTIHFNTAGDYYLNSSSDFSGDLNVVVSAGVVFKNALGFATVTFSCDSVDIQGMNQIVAPAPIAPSMMLDLQTDRPMDVYPEWYGADGDGIVEDSFAIERTISGSSSKNTVVLSAASGYHCGNSTLDFSGHVLKIEESSKILCEGSSITVDRLVANSGSPVFFGADLDRVYFDKPVARSEWFDWTVSDIIKTDFVKNFIATNTQSGNRQFKWIVGPGIAHLDDDISEAECGNTYHLKFNWTFEEGASFSLTSSGYIEFGYVNAGNYKIFSSTESNDYKMIFMNDLKLGWWGAISGIDEEVTNMNAIRAAYSQAVRSTSGNNQRSYQRITVDLCGGAYKTKPVSAASTSGIIDGAPLFKNGAIWGDDDSASYFMSFPHGIQSENVSWDSRGGTTALFNVATNGDVRFRTCHLDSAFETITSASNGKLVVEDCDIEINNTSVDDLDIIVHGGENSVFKDNRVLRTQNNTTGLTWIDLGLSHAAVRHNKFEGVGVKVYGSGEVVNNYIDRGSIYSTNPASTIIQGNKIKTSDHMDAQIYFYSANTSHRVEGLVCTHNTFQDGTADLMTRPNYYAIDTNISMHVGSTYYQQHRAEVHSNHCITAYQFYGTTRIETGILPPDPLIVWPAGYNRINMDVTRSAVGGSSNQENHQYFVIFADVTGSALTNLNMFADQLANQNDGVNWVNVRGNVLTSSGLFIDFNLSGSVYNLVLSGDACRFNIYQSTYPLTV